MTLTVWCMTSDPGARVAAILRQLRPIADEVLVAVDSRVEEHRLGRYAEVADRLLRFEFVDSVEQAALSIAARCSGDWLLRIDGDEVVTPGLIERVPEMIAASDVFQYWLSCRWLFPDAEHYLPQPPWHYSTPRLVRNDPATLWHAGLSHGRFEPVFPSVRLEEGYYHLSLLVNDIAHREAKVARYLSIQSGHSRRVIEDDVTAFYLPERDSRFGTAVVPVPASDRAAIAEVLAASGEELPGPPAREIPMLSWSEIQRLWPRRALPESAYRGEIELFERAPVLEAGELRPVAFRVTNAGGEHWPGMGREPSIVLSHRWLPATATDTDADTATDTATGSAPGSWVGGTILPAALAPGASALVPIAIAAPPDAGRRTLEVALVHEDLPRGGAVRRFAAVELPIEVRPPRGDSA